MERTRKKLHLNLGDLAVDTFSTIASNTTSRGTVRGRNEESVDFCTIEPTMNPYVSCGLCSMELGCDTGQFTCFDPTCGENTCAQTCDFDDTQCTTQTYPSVNVCP